MLARLNERGFLTNTTLLGEGVTDEGETREVVAAYRAVLDVKKPGAAIVKVRWTPYWFASGSCVEPSGAWTKVIAKKVGFVRLSTRFAPERLFERGRRCDDG